MTSDVISMTSKEARQQAQAEGLTLRVAESNKTGYFGVNLNSRPGQPKPYAAQVRRGGKKVSLGCFATAEEAALCIARTLEGQAAAERTAAAPPLQPALPPPAPPAYARRTAPPPRRWRSSPGSRSCDRGTPSPGSA